MSGGWPPEEDSRRWRAARHASAVGAGHDARDPARGSSYDWYAPADGEDGGTGGEVAGGHGQPGWYAMPPGPRDPSDYSGGYAVPGHPAEDGYPEARYAGTGYDGPGQQAGYGPGAGGAPAQGQDTGYPLPGHGAYGTDGYGSGRGYGADGYLRSGGTDSYATGHEGYSGDEGYAGTGQHSGYPVPGYPAGEQDYGDPGYGDPGYGDPGYGDPEYDAAQYPGPAYDLPAFGSPSGQDAGAGLPFNSWPGTGAFGAGLGTGNGRDGLNGPGGASGYGGATGYGGASGFGPANGDGAVTGYDRLSGYGESGQYAEGGFGGAGAPGPAGGLDAPAPAGFLADETRLDLMAVPPSGADPGAGFLAGETRLDLMAVPPSGADPGAGFLAGETRLDNGIAAGLAGSGAASATSVLDSGPGLAGMPPPAEATSIDLPAAAPRRGGKTGAPGRTSGRTIGRRRGRSGDRRLWLVLGAVMALAALAIVAIVMLAFPSGPSGPPHTLVTPSKLGSFARRPSLEQQMNVGELRKEVVSTSSGQASHVVDSVYESGTSAPGTTPQILVFIGGNLANAAPQASVTSFIQKFKGATVTSAGSKPGQADAACVNATASQPGSLAICAWFDNDSFGVVVSPTMKASSLAATMRSVRPDVELIAKQKP